MGERPESQKDRRAALGLAVNRVFHGSEPTLRTTPTETTGSAQPKIFKPRWRRGTGTFPRSFAEFRSGPPYDHTHSLSGELRQTMTVIEGFAPQLAEFVKVKTRFESELIGGDANQAQTLLEDIRQRFGVSIWFAEASFLLANRLSGLEGIRLRCSEFSTETDSIVVSFLLYWIARRTEPATSASSYDDAIEDMLSVAAQEQYRVSVVEYIRFRLNPHITRQFNELDLYLYRESHFPVVDQYLALIRILQRVAAAGEPHEDWGICVNCLHRLTILIEDPTTLVLRALMSPSDARCEEAALRNIPLIDLYTAGTYNRCALECESRLSAEAHSMELYALHGKSMIAGDIFPHNPFYENRTAYDIYRHVFEILSNGDESYEAIQSLQKIAYAFTDLTIGPQLTAFCAISLGSVLPASGATLLATSSTSLGPQMSEAIPAPRSVSFITYLSKCCPDSNSTRLFSSLIKDQVITDDAAPPYRVHKYRCRLHEMRQDFRQAIDGYRKLSELIPNPQLYQADIAIGLYRCFIASGEIFKCIQHTVEVYLKKKPLLMSVRLEALMEPLLKETTPPPNDRIEWPIICYIYQREAATDQDNYRIFVAYDQFLACNNAARPTDLLASIDKFDLSTLIFFLRYICVPAVMRRAALAFRSAAAVDAERIGVCQQLLMLEPEESEATQQEIVTLATQSMIRRAIRDVGERKVYVDIAAIRQVSEHNLKEKYERYAANIALSDERLRKSFRHSGVSFARGDKLIQLNAPDEGFIAFKELFSELRSQFLFNPAHGLNFFFSVRIRHGTIEGQIRRRFQQLHLVTTQDAEGQYHHNEHWQESFAQGGHHIAELADQTLRKLSSDVDRIIERVRDRWIQIKSKANNFEGLFDFDFSDEQLLQQYIVDRIIVMPTSEDLINALLAELWSRTTNQLEKVRRRISRDLKDEFVTLLDNVEKSISSLSPYFHNPAFSAAVASCRTDIQNDLDVVAGWFNVVDQQEIQDFEFSLAVDTGIEIIRGLSPTCVFEPTLDVERDVICHGASFIHFVDILKILFENVVEHAKMTRPIVSISAKVNNNRLVLVVANDLPAGIDIAERRSHIERVKQNLERGDASVAGEGGTGFLKIRKIIQGGLQRAFTKFNVTFALESDTRFVAEVSLDLTRIRI